MTVNHFSTIAAVATPPGKGGVAVIRISGTEAVNVAGRVFFPQSGKALCEIRPRTQVFGNIIYNGEIIDDGLATVFSAPHSYTGENVVEISCHGGILVTATVLEAVLSSGAVPADAGEFTRRAFINGKLSLTSAEAIGNLIEAQSREQIRLNSIKSRNALSEKIAHISDTLTSVLGDIYARIDYPDEELGDYTEEDARRVLCDAKENISALLKTYGTGKAISEGIETVICGKPNVGKSTLYNLLVGKDAAIVTDIKGTTRDILTEKLPLGRVMLRLSDTAGVRDSGEDVIEKIGIDRSLEKIRTSELILAVFDISNPLDKEDEKILKVIHECGGAKLAILNKVDTGKRSIENFPKEMFLDVIELSAKEDDRSAVLKLSSVIDKHFTNENIVTGEDAVISSARQNASLKEALEYISSAIGGIDIGISLDAVSSDIERAVGAVSRLSGKSVSEEVVADIFSRFCVGK